MHVSTPMNKSSPTAHSRCSWKGDSMNNHAKKLLSRSLCFDSQATSLLALSLPLSCFPHAVMIAVHVLFSSKAANTYTHINTYTCTHTHTQRRIIPTGLMSQQPASSYALHLSVSLSLSQSHPLPVSLSVFPTEGLCFCQTVRQTAQPAT